MNNDTGKGRDENIDSIFQWKRHSVVGLVRQIITLWRRNGRLEIV